MANDRDERGSWCLFGGAALGIALLVASGCREHGVVSREGSAGAGARTRAAATASVDAGGAANASVDAGGAANANASEEAHVERIRVPGDVAASIVRTSAGAAPTTVFLPGMCSNANAYLQAFPAAARRQGGIVAIEGDQRCGALEGFHSFSWDAAKLHQRIEAAVAAAGLEAVPRDGLTLVGYSQGAALGEQLVQRWPSRYARLVLIGAPTEPSAARLSGARGIVTMSCARDVPQRMKQATSRLLRAGIPSTYLEMPGCTHGNIADGERTFDAAFDWLRANARAPKEDATAQPLVGKLGVDG